MEQPGIAFPEQPPVQANIGRGSSGTPLRMIEPVYGRPPEHGRQDPVEPISGYGDGGGDQGGQNKLRLKHVSRPSWPEPP